MHRICVLTRGRLWSLNPLCMEKGGCVCVCVCVCVCGLGLLAEGVCGWCGRAGHPRHTHEGASVHLLFCSPVICSLPSVCLQPLLPGVCNSTLQLFAVATRLFADRILRGVQLPPQLFTASTLRQLQSLPQLFSHLPSCLQLPPTTLG